jgi:gliding motility-associated-like protein
MVTGGNGTYTYRWSNGLTTSTLSNLPVGSYSLSVNDASGCSTSSSINISQPTAVAIQTVPTNVTCNGAGDGAISVQLSGGVGSYTYVWSNQSTAQQLSHLNAGSYTVTAKDANACSVTGTATITQPSPVTVSTAYTNYACAGSAGSINITVGGGTAPYTYNWQDGAITQNRTGLAAGNYQVTITDQNHCTQTGSVTIAQVPQLSASLTQTNVSCNGGDNGKINITVTGGSQPYSYNWSNTANTGDIQNLAAANYNVIVTDASGCSISTGTSISQPAAIQVSSNITSVKCFGNSNGSVTVVANGGTAPLTFTWSNNSTSQNLSSLQAGNYRLTVTDANSCTTVLQNVVTQPAQLSLTAAVTPVGCSGLNDGSAVITTSGGTPPFAYNWSNNAKAANLDSLAAGTYAVTVNDNNGCTANQTITINSSAPLVITPAVQNASCIGVNNGSISLNVTGGTLPYNYDWNNGQTADAATGLAAGNYAVTVTDSKGCSATSGGDISISYELNVHAAASVTSTTGTPVQLTATTNTDHSNTYRWTPVNYVTCATCANTAATPQQTTLFTVNVVDINGCKAEDTVTINVNTSTDIFIPNAFTPNNDGVNDQFKMFGELSNIYFLDISVFDRWGEKVFESNDPNFEWDGTYRGEPAPIGVYIYVATAVFNNGSHRDFKGSVTLLR